MKKTFLEKCSSISLRCVLKRKMWFSSLSEKMGIFSVLYVAFEVKKPLEVKFDRNDICEENANTVYITLAECRDDGFRGLGVWSDWFRENRKEIEKKYYRLREKVGDARLVVYRGSSTTVTLSGSAESDWKFIREVNNVEDLFHMRQAEPRRITVRTLS